MEYKKNRQKRGGQKRGGDKNREDTPQEDIRFLALEVVTEVTEKGQFLHHVTDALLTKYAYLSKRDRGFLLHLAAGTVERRLTLDALINRTAHTPVEKQRPVIRNILRLGVFQICFMDKIPDRAACSESVKLCRKKGFSHLTGFVNGVLRGIVRKKEANELFCEADGAGRLSIKYSLPQWIADRWIELYGDDKAQTMMQSLYGEHLLTVRMQTSVADKEKMMESIKEDHAHVEPHLFGGDLYILSDFDGLTQLSAFREGMFAVQDASSALVAGMAALKGGELVLDLCSAPGGKACHMADILAKKGKGGRVTARDLSCRKLEKIRENVVRLKLDNVDICQADASVFDRSLSEKYDVVAADVPCSGLGVLGRKTDLKYRIKEEEIGELVALQRKILNTAAEYVKKGGRLVYSTCTVEKRENEDNIRWFLSEHAGFSLVDIRENLPEILKKEAAPEGWIQLLPGVHPCDGFFIAVLQKGEQR